MKKDALKIDVNQMIWGENNHGEKKVGLFFGTFNPIHVGHLIIANYIVNATELDEVWFVVTPHNPHKEKAGLLKDHHRLVLVQEAILDNPKFKVSNIEFNLSQPNYTINTLAHLKEKYPKKDFALIMGEDNLRTLHKWKNYEQIIAEYGIIIYPRVIQSSEGQFTKEANNLLAQHDNIIRCEAPTLTISSSFIRNSIKNNIDVKYMLTEPVYNYIDEMNFYK